MAYVSPTYSLQTFAEYLEFQARDPSVAANSRFRPRGMHLILRTDPDTLKSDLVRALDTPGAIVVYIGHANLSKRLRRTYGLVTRPDKWPPDVTNDELAYLVSKAKAKAFVIGGCSSDRCLGRTRSEMYTVVTHSGRDQVTDSTSWAAAIEEWFDRLLDTPPWTLHQALMRANAEFATVADYFIAVGGDGSMTLDASPAQVAPP